MPPIEFTPDGKEIPDPTPIQIPAGFKRPESLIDQMRRLIRTDVSQFAEQQGAESFEESNDFDMDDDDAELRTTSYEEMHEEVPREQREPRSDKVSPKKGATREVDEDDRGSDDRVDDEPAPRRDEDTNRRRDREPRSHKRKSQEGVRGVAPRTDSYRQRRIDDDDDIQDDPN